MSPDLLRSLIRLAGLIAEHRAAAATDPVGRVRIVVPPLASRPGRCCAFWVFSPWWLWARIRDTRNGARALYGSARAEAEDALDAWDPQRWMTVATRTADGALATAHITQAATEDACVATLRSVLRQRHAQTVSLVFPAGEGSDDVTLLQVGPAWAHAFAVSQRSLASGQVRPVPRRAPELAGLVAQVQDALHSVHRERV